MVHKTPFSKKHTNHYISVHSLQKEKTHTSYNVILKNILVYTIAAQREYLKRVSKCMKKNNLEEDPKNKKNDEGRPKK